MEMSQQQTVVKGVEIIHFGGLSSLSCEATIHVTKSVL